MKLQEYRPRCGVYKAVFWDGAQATMDRVRDLAKLAGGRASFQRDESQHGRWLVVVAMADGGSRRYRPGNWLAFRVPVVGGGVAGIREIGKAEFERDFEVVPATSAVAVAEDALARFEATIGLVRRDGPPVPGLGVRHIAELDSDTCSLCGCPVVKFYRWPHCPGSPPVSVSRETKVPLGTVDGVEIAGGRSADDPMGLWAGGTDLGDDCPGGSRCWCFPKYDGRGLLVKPHPVRLYRGKNGETK